MQKTIKKLQDQQAQFVKNIDELNLTILQLKKSNAATKNGSGQPLSSQSARGSRMTPIAAPAPSPTMSKASSVPVSEKGKDSPESSSGAEGKSHLPARGIISAASVASSQSQSDLPPPPPPQIQTVRRSNRLASTSSLPLPTPAPKPAVPIFRPSRPRDQSPARSDDGLPVAASGHASVRSSTRHSARGSGIPSAATTPICRAEGSKENLSTASTSVATSTSVQRAQDAVQKHRDRMMKKKQEENNA